MPVSGRAVGWLTVFFTAAGVTVAVVLLEHPRTMDVRVLAGVGVLLSSLVAGWTARMMYRGAAGPGTWPVAAPCVVIGALMGAVTFLLLCALIEVILVIGLAHSNLTW